MNNNVLPIANPFLFNVEYEQIFSKELRTLKEYCPLAYKDLISDKGFKLREEGNQGINEIDLFTSKEFKILYGQIRLVYELIGNHIKLLGIEPIEIFIDGFLVRPKFVYGIPVFNKKDKFKVTLLRKMEEIKDGSY